MNKLYSLVFALMILLSLPVVGQDFWKKATTEDIFMMGLDRSIPEMKSEIYLLETENLKTYLADAPKEFSASKGLEIKIPLEDGAMKTFFVFDSPVMESEIAERYPNIKSFVGTSRDGDRIHMGYGDKGFYAIIKYKTRTIIVDNFNFDNDLLYAVYDMHDYPSDYHTTFKCENEEHDHDEVQDYLDGLLHELEGDRNGNPIAYRSYRLAMATSTQYSARFGSTKASVMEELNKLVNRVNMVFHNELAVKLILIDKNDELIQLAGSAYTNGNAQAMIEENPIVLQANGVFPEDYDIGHVLGTNGGGLAQLFSLCSGGGQPEGSSKARGVSTWFTVVGDPFHIQVVAHEVGHQFGAPHSFNNCNFGGNESEGTGYEPGSGHTIMSYLGLCGPDNAEGEQLDNYNWHSLNAMFGHITGGAGSCGTIIQNVNTRPTSFIDIEEGFTIPIGTPFKLTGRAEDNESAESELTYSWEQADLGPKSRLGEPEGTAPLFRVYAPSSSPTRYFPNLPHILSGTTTREEVLPTTTRPLTFRFVVRDNDQDGGAYIQSEIEFSSSAEAGPFKIITPTAGQTYEVGDYIQLEWDVAGTDVAPVNCKNVNILIASNNGQDFFTVASNVVNSGSIDLEIPDMVSGGLRFYIEAADNIFFNVSNGNFSIVEASEPSLSIVPQNYYLQVCTPEIVDVVFDITPLGGFDGTAEITYLGGLPDDIDIVFNKTTVNSSDQLIATLTIDSSIPLGVNDFEIEIETSTGLIFQRRIQVDILTLNASDIDVVGPEDGMTGINGAPTLRWTSVDHAEEYVVTLKSLDGSINYTITTTDTVFVISDLLPPATVFYWTVNIVNRCGYTPGENQRLFTFATVNSSCETYDAGLSQGSPFILPSNSPGIKDMILNIPAGGAISDINIPKFIGGSSNNGELSYLTIDLISPEGTKVTLARNQCVAMQPWNIPFDDDLNTAWSCQLADGTPRRTQFNNLKNFIGEDAEGDWIFRFDNNSNSNAQIRGIALEVCGNIETAPISLIHNEVLEVPTLQYQTISGDWLKVEDAVSSNDELIYTVLELPKKGHIERYGTYIGQGNTFTQSALNDFGMIYYHTGSELDTEDNFIFVVTNSTGAYIGTLVFDIVISEEFTVSTTEEPNTINFNVYPNPTKGIINIDIPTLYHDCQIDIINMNGQTMYSIAEGNDGFSNQINVSAMVAGTYIVRLSSSEGVGFKKVIIL